MRPIWSVMILLAIAGGAVAEELWDNNAMTNGSGGRAISPPGFPDIRVADDFVIPRDSDGWLVGDIHYTAVEDAGWVWNDGDGIDVFIYEDKGGQPGAIIATRTPGSSKMATGDTYFGRANYRYWAEFEDDPIELGPGTYWVSVRHTSAGGTGSNYWMTSDGGLSGGASTGYFSVDSGKTWDNEGDTWHHAFTVNGRRVPEPTTLMLLAVGGLAALRRRR